MKPAVLYPLFRPVAKRNDPESSFRAGEEVHRSGRAYTQRLVVLAALKQHGPCTSKELAAMAGWNDRYLGSRRLPELANEGKVKKTLRHGEDTLWEAL